MPAYHASDARGFGNKQSAFPSSFKKERKKDPTWRNGGARWWGTFGSLAISLWFKEGKEDFITDKDLWGAEFLWGQSTRNGQGISMMEHSVPVPEVLHLSWVPSSPQWCESTIIKCLQPKWHPKSIQWGTGVTCHESLFRERFNSVHQCSILHNTAFHLFSLGLVDIFWNTLW